jgi:putative PIN family toxin of toxin-antitoxin system
MIFAVIDTNVFVSALLTKHRDSATAKVVEAVLDGRITALKSPEIISEYREVLARPHFQFPEGTVTRILATVETDGIDLSAQSSPEEFSDESDRVFFEVALAGAAFDTKLVTGNLKHYPSSPIVVTPSQMVALLESSYQ